MKEVVFTFVEALPAWFQVLLVAAVPIVEFRGAIPFALEVHGFSVLEAIILTTIGNMLPFIPLYFGLASLRRLLAKYMPRLVAPLDAFIKRADHKLRDHFERYGALALLLFVAIPLPLTGVWTATVGAVSLKIPVKHAGLALTGGVIIGSIIVALITKGALAIINE
ncbi:small multi-drug export protein [Patescibacteria group bacterium]|nr:small multi-drug export protein [Patescibacteria group bacterium]